jgi:hypothetical protein
MGVESLDFPVGEEGEKKVKSERGEFWMVCVAPGTLRRESQLPSKLEEICKRCTGQNLVFPYTTTRTRTECRARRRRSGRERDWGVVVNAVEVCRCLLCLRAGPRVLNRNAGPERTSPAPLHPTSAAGEDEAEKRSLASYKCTGGEWTCRWTVGRCSTASGLVPPLQLRERPLPYYGALGRDRSLDAGDCRAVAR